MKGRRPIERTHVAETERMARKLYPHTFQDKPEIDLSGLRDTTVEVVEKVLEQICSVSEQDYSRIFECVVSIEPLSTEESEDGTLGQWFRDHSAGEIGRAEGINWPGIIKINEDAANLRFILAHEFGHACETHEDSEEHDCPNDEWISEAIANRYVYQWGFHEELEKFWAGKEMDRHHGCPPGTEFEEMGLVFVVTEDHRLVRKRGTEPQEG